MKTKALLTAAIAVLFFNSQNFAQECQGKCQKSLENQTFVSYTGDDKGSGKKASSEAKDIVDTAVGAKKFKTLVAAVQAAGLVETLKGKGPFTVFAPTDEAFAKLPEGTIKELLKPENKKKLVSILTYHVVSGKVLAEDVVKIKKAKTVNGKEVQVKVTDKGVMIDNAKVVKTDINCANGVIHVIDTVILPK